MKPRDTSSVGGARPVRNFLRRLNATGPYGFEGLVACLLESATGQRFRLAGSGTQEGRDAESESGFGNRIRVEAKSYWKSKLVAQNLRDKLLQASLSAPAPDLWVLVATCEVDARLVQDLEGIGQRFQVEILILDARVDSLSRIEVLMAHRPDAVRTFLSNHPSISRSPPSLFSALRAISTDETFDRELAQILGRLNGTLLGYDAARLLAAEALTQTLRSSGSTLNRFNQHIGVRDEAVSRVERSDSFTRIQTWWTSAGRAGKHGVILASEGQGKTWALFDWLAVGIAQADMPLVLPFNASAEPLEPTATIESILPQLLSKWVGIGDRDCWQQRLARWLAASDTSPLILVVADGLNEKPGQNWPSFFRALSDPRLIGRVVALATDRRGHWMPNCGSLETAGFLQIPISGYTDRELEVALRARSVRYEEVPDALHELIRTPRYCDLVCEHFQPLVDSNDFTIERLIFLDMKHRRDARPGFPLSDDDFIEIIRNAARRYLERMSPMSRAEVRSLMPAPYGTPEVHEEIVTGGLLQRTEDGRFVVEHTRLVYGLGMLMADDLRCIPASELDKAREVAARALEPHPDMDIKIEICGAALFHAFIDSTYPEHIRRVLLRLWLSQRNWSHQSFGVFGTYVVRRPEDFVAIAEEFWSSAGDHGAAQEFIIGAFCAHRDRAEVLPVLGHAMEGWLGIFHPAGHPFSRGANGERTTENRSRTARKLGAAAGPGSVPVMGYSLTCVEDDGLLRLRRAALRVISSGTREPFADAICAWAISSSLMGGAGELSAAAWVIRLGSGNLESLLLPVAKRWLSLEDDLAVEAARILLQCVGSIEARTLLAQYPREEASTWQQLRAEHARDPCTGPFELTDEECRRCLERDDVPLGRMLSKLRNRILDPTWTVPSVFVKRTIAFLEQLDEMAIRASINTSTADHAVEQVTPVASTRAPDELATLWRRVLRTLPARGRPAIRSLAFHLPTLIPVIGETEKEAILSTIASVQASHPEWGRENSEVREDQDSEAFLTLGVLAQLSADSQLRLLLERPGNALDLVKFEHWFQPSPHTTEHLADVLRSSKNERVLSRTLWILGSTTPVLPQADLDRITQLADHDDWLVRGNAMRYACLSANEELARQMIALGRKFTELKPYWEMYWGATLLLKFGKELPIDALLDRLSPAVVSYAFEQQRTDNDLTTFLGFIDQSIARILRTTSLLEVALPGIVVPSTEGSALGWPRFTQHAQPSLHYKDPSTTWTSGSSASIQDVFSSLSPPSDAELREQARKQVEAIETAWRTEALQWFGRKFSTTFFDRTHVKFPGALERWVTHGLGSGPAPAAARLHLVSFYVGAMATLCDENPKLGFALWERYRTETPSGVEMDLAEIAFAALDSAESTAARATVLAECASDKALFRVASLAQLHKRETWLRGIIEEDLADGRLWRKARGLTLMSFAPYSIAEFRSVVSDAVVEGWWLKDGLKPLMKYRADCDCAQHWYKRYLDEPNVIVAWASFLAFLCCVDSRFEIWGGELENACDRLPAWKGAFIKTNQDAIANAMKVNERGRDRTLFGLQVERGEIFPFDA